MEDPFFTVVVPAYNCKSFILETIDSVRNQTFDNWELIIVDDNSSDGTFDLVKEYIKNEPKINLYQTEKNFGSPGGPRDFGAKKAKGKFLAFLDGDDTYFPQKLEKHYKAILDNPTIEFLHTSFNIVNEQGGFIKHQKKQWFLRLYEQLFSLRTVCLLTNPFCISSTVIKKEFFKDYTFRTVPDLVSAVEDWFLWNRILNDKKPIIHYHKEPLVNYRWVQDSISDREAHRCELQSITFFSILLNNRQINFFEWGIAILIRHTRIFASKFLGYGRN